MYRCLRIVLAAFVASLLLACGTKVQDSKEQAALDERKILAQQICARSQITTDSGEDSIDAYLDQLKRMEALESHLISKYGYRAFSLCGRPTRDFLVQERADISIMRSRKVLVESNFLETMRSLALSQKLVASIAEENRLMDGFANIGVSSSASDEALGIAKSLARALIDCYDRRIEMIGEGAPRPFQESRDSALSSKEAVIKLVEYVDQILSEREAKKTGSTEAGTRAELVRFYFVLS